MASEPAHDQSNPLTSLPRLEDLPRSSGGGYEPDGVRAAFDNFRRHVLQLQAQLRVLQAAGQSANVDPTGHAVRMDALHLIRAASEFADVLERDAQAASAAQLGRTEEEVRRRQKELQALDATNEAKRSQTKNEASEMRKNGERDASAALLEAEARGTRLVEQARHKSTEMANGARAEVEQTLDWARSQASAIIFRAQDGAEKLLTAAGLGPDALGEVAGAIMDAARSGSQATTPPLMGTAPQPAPPSSQPAPAAPEQSTKAQGESE